MAILAGMDAFRDPEARARSRTAEQRVRDYDTAWNYYRNLMFSRRSGVNWAGYLNSYDMYKHTRLMFNPIGNVVNFHADNIWRSVPDTDFESLVTPVVPTTDEEITAAVAQIDQWSNFQAESQLIKRYCAALGNVLVEGMDDMDRQKVYHKTIWPGYITDLQLNAVGDVISYVLEYDVFDRVARETYRFRKNVTKDVTKYFRNDRPFVPEGKTKEEEPNPYGFVFAVWMRHENDGSDYGSAAFTHWDKVDEVNSLGSHLHDHIHKAIESPKILSTTGDAVPIIGGTQDPTTGLITPHDPRLNWVVMKTTSGASVHDLAGSLALDEAHPYLQELLASFSDDYPEIQAQAVIKQNTQLSGAALERLLTPAQNRLNGSQANYNPQLVKLRQMQLAVGGMRVNGGGWSRDDKAKDVFRPFNLSSYGKGDLNFSLVATKLIENSEAETEDLMMKKGTRAIEMQPLVGDHEAYRIAGYSEDEITEILAEKATENSILTEGEPPAPPVLPAPAPVVPNA